MTEPREHTNFATIFLVALALLITGLFFAMIRGFLVAIFLAAIFTGMLQGPYRRLVRWLGGRKTPAAILTILIFVFVLIVPISLFLGIVVSQALDVSASVGPWVQREISQPRELDRLLEGLPFWETIQPYQDQILTKVAEFAGRIGTFLVTSVAAVSRGTARFFFQLFILLYAMYFFLINGRAYLVKVLYYVPLESEAEGRLVARFVSVTRATIKGTLLIGVIQGGLAGLAFMVAGINGWAFWTVIMIVFSIIPAIGTALVWIPATIYLFALGQTAVAIGLAVWCAVVVGMVDNVLRPRLVGRDTELSDLLILLGTLGGLVFFGAVGFIIGPIIAALFVTVWEIYGETFADYLPQVEVPLTDTIVGMPMVSPPDPGPPGPPLDGGPSVDTTPDAVE
jgi:predicted PurR-regulated permease PerM